MSNMQMGTRGLSSGDLTRLKRLRGSRDFQANVLSGGKKDVNPPPFNQLGYTPNLHNPKHMGSSRIRRTASSFTDFKGFIYSDFVTQSESTYVDITNGTTTNTNGKALIAHKLCKCTITGNGYINPKKEGLCPQCSK
jgi:hypothetical protein